MQLSNIVRDRIQDRLGIEQRVAGSVPATAKWSFTARRVREDDVRGLSTDFANVVAGDVVLARTKVLGQHKKIQLPAVGRPRTSSGITW